MDLGSPGFGEAPCHLAPEAKGHEIPDGCRRQKARHAAFAACPFWSGSQQSSRPQARKKRNHFRRNSFLPKILLAERTVRAKRVRGAEHSLLDPKPSEAGPGQSAKRYFPLAP